MLMLFEPDKSRIVEEGNYHKFTKSKNHEQMLKMLLDTGDRELVEVRNAIMSNHWHKTDAHYL
jgi:predicted NAD-dependent protein-ADP-ribosyltransferase YbiA (DUF1768 family)